MLRRNSKYPIFHFYIFPIYPIVFPPKEILPDDCSIPAAKCSKMPRGVLILVSPQGKKLAPILCPLSLIPTC